jgi:hypothetical protein
MPHELLRLHITNENTLAVELSPWLVLAFLIALVLALGRLRRKKHFELVTVEIALGGIGKIAIKPSWDDIRIAHKIWTELVTRKAAIPLDTDNDVIVEVLDSWYALFLRVRQLVSEIPAEAIRKEESTRTIVTIAVDSLNVGLRPCLTKWQAQFRHWWAATEGERKSKTPQAHQRTFPEYSALVGDLQVVNAQLIEYADQLRKIVRGV